jgi:hypothetical protein
MKIEAMESIEKGNPYSSDFYHMGTTIGSNVTIMYGQHNHEKQPYIIIVDTETGKRIRVRFE